MHIKRGTKLISTDNSWEIENRKRKGEVSKSQKAGKAYR